jgi:3-oxoacyl-[acyl-carrier-protein] synthase II
MKNTNKRVVVTGVGPVTAIGTGKEAFWKNLCEGNANIKAIPPQFENSYRFKSRFYVPFPVEKLEDHDIPGKYETVMGTSSQVAVIAAKLALEDAGIPWTREDFELPADPDRCAVVLGTGICNLKAGFDAHEAHALNPAMRFNRMVIPMIMPDAASSWISILFGTTGVNYTLNASCASGTMAIGEAFLKIRSGDADLVLAGGFECLKDESGTVMRGFDSLGTLTTASDGYPLPFSRERTGFLFAEGGAGILVIESLDHARERGAVPYAEILGYAACSDAYNIVQMEPSGARVMTMINELTTGRKIDYFNAHGTATQLNDETEARVIRSVFGVKETQPVINSTKGITGHSIGASGAMEAAATVLSIQRGMIHKNLTSNIMDYLNVNLETIHCDIRMAVSASFGFGGHNAALLFGKADLTR